MAIKLQTVIYRWTGMSSDVKPSSGVAEGSTFHYVDTGEEFVYHNGMWEDDVRSLAALSDDAPAVKFHRETGAVAIASTLAPSTDWQLESIRVHLSAAGGAGDLTATIDHGSNAVYDILLLTQDMTAVTDLVWHCERPMEFLAGDELDIAWANANTRTYGLEIVYKGI